MAIQHSPDQLNAIDGIQRQILDSSLDKFQLMVLTGSAGTGKTTVVKELLTQIKQWNPLANIVLAATTNRAATIMEEIVRQRVRTVHKVFKLRPEVTKFGKEALISSGKCEIPFGSVVIIDESSMIGDTFLKAIANITTTLALKIVFVGDPFQLPPPNDTCSIFDGSMATFTLTQVHRQAGGNPILDKANEFREYIDGTRPEMPKLQTCINTKGEGIHVLSHADFITQFVSKYVNYTAGAPIDIPLCTFTNDSAIGYNTMVRKATYFLSGEIKPFYPGERLIANSVVLFGKDTIINNNEVVHVISYTPSTPKDSLYNGMRGYMVTVKGDYISNIKSDIKRVFVPESKLSLETALKVLKDTALKSRSKHDWVSFYALKNSIADLRPPFAGTTHKAQGGTFPAIFIDTININKCRDTRTRARLMYVALTRATTNVYINS